MFEACDVLSRMVELNAVLPSLESLTAEFCSSPVDLETWRRVPAMFPSLYSLDLRDQSTDIGDVVVKEVVPDFPNLREIRLKVAGLRLKTCLVLAVKVLKRHPRDPVSVECKELIGEVAGTAATVLDALEMIPSCRVTILPDDPYIGESYLCIER
jgi:hypothetical protein